MITASRRRTNDGSPIALAASRIPSAFIPACQSRIPTATARRPIAPATSRITLASIPTLPGAIQTVPASIQTTPDASPTAPARPPTPPDFAKPLVFLQKERGRLVRVLGFELAGEPPALPATISPQRFVLRMEKQKRKEVNESWQKTKQFPWPATA
jgi:hypothetical protein